jgi:hypothetical protein
MRYAPFLPVHAYLAQFPKSEITRIEIFADFSSNEGVGLSNRNSCRISSGACPAGKGLPSLICLANSAMRFRESRVHKTSEFKTFTSPVRGYFSFDNWSTRRNIGYKKVLLIDSLFELNKKGGKLGRSAIVERGKSEDSGVTSFFPKLATAHGKRQRNARLKILDDFRPPSLEGWATLG